MEDAQVIDDRNTLEYWKDRAGTPFNQRVARWIKDGVNWEPNNDMILYCQSIIPKLSEEDLKESDPEVLEAMFEGDVEGDVTERRLYLIKKGPNCTNMDTYALGDQITVRGNAFKLNLKEGIFFTVRDYDVIGRHTK